ncbi:farnesol dehydrogenase-like [Rhopalosiphum padi]|uniref:farnesol dehydrogenase-like n=1 Tax=Rhopalosiphum padi TaxID=40932 RepID=UPI00298D7234|nr:farnesol dehydrogenase-like [Rhopalosiphum padi]XP_060841753.1 farnesol dehydrogenase-like [Rhopalosiphum padi]
MDKWIGKVAVVTGVSSGIGEETCRQLVKHGMIVVGFARKEHRLQELKKELKDNFYYVKVDLCSEKNILDAFQWVKVTLKSIDVLINNAGVLKLTDIFGDTQDWKLMFDTNVIGLNICSREAVKLMKEMEIKEGHIINVNSITGHYIMSGMKDFSVYGSTKFSVTALSEYLREFMSMENLPIRVTSISPGFVDTKMIEKFKFEDNTVLQTIDIADAIVYALSAPKRVNVAEIILRPLFDNMLHIVNSS